MLKEAIFTSVHIEKSGGTAITDFYRRQLGSRRVAFYRPSIDRVIRNSDFILSPSNPFVDAVKERVMDTPLWPVLKDAYLSLGSRRGSNDDAPTIPEGIRVIHGHFKADRFDDEIDFQIQGVAFRDPLARMRSHYTHWKRTKGNAEFRLVVPFNPNMTFEEFAILPQLQDYQSQALAGKDLSCFGTVGISDKGQLDSYIASIHDIFIREGYYEGKPKELEPLRRLNRTPQNKKVPPSLSERKFEEAFRQFHSIDYALYEQAAILLMRNVRD